MRRTIKHNFHSIVTTVERAVTTVDSIVCRGLIDHSLVALREPIQNKVRTYESRTTSH